MLADHVYACGSITPTGWSHSIDIIIKVPKTKILECRQEPSYDACDDQEIVRDLFARRIAPTVYSVPGATYTVGCTLYPEGDPPAPEVLDRPENQEIEGIRSWRLDFARL